MVPTSNTVDLDRRLPDSEIVIYPDAGHGGIFQFHDEFVATTLEFLARDRPPHAPTDRTQEHRP